MSKEKQIELKDNSFSFLKAVKSRSLNSGNRYRRVMELIYLKHNIDFFMASNCLFCKARFKRRILHAPNRIAKLTACKMRRLNQLNATHFNSMRVSRIFDWSSRICDWTSTVDLNAAFYMCRIELKSSWIIYVCSNGNLKHVTRAQQFYSAKRCDV